MHDENLFKKKGGGIKKVLGFFLIVFTLFIISPDVLYAGLEEPKDKGVYLAFGGNGGGQTISVQGGESRSNSGVGIQVMGGWHFHRNFAVELGYSGLNFTSKLAFRGMPTNMYYWTHEIGPRIILRSNGAVDWYGFLTAGILAAQWRAVDNTGRSALPDRVYSGGFGGGGGGVLFHWGEGWFAGPEVAITGHGYSMEGRSVSGSRFLGTLRIGFEWFSM